MGLIVWSPKATSDFEQILDYLLVEWNEEVAFEFADEVDKTISIISLLPEVYPTVNNRLVRKAVVVKQVSLFYRIDKRNGDVRLLRLWDTRQNPAKLKL